MERRTFKSRVQRTAHCVGTRTVEYTLHGPCIMYIYNFGSRPGTMCCPKHCPVREATMFIRIWRVPSSLQPPAIGKCMWQHSDIMQFVLPFKRIQYQAVSPSTPSKSSLAIGDNGAGMLCRPRVAIVVRPNAAMHMCTVCIYI